jgi:hypothetical protein
MEVRHAVLPAALAVLLLSACSRKEQEPATQAAAPPAAPAAASSTAAPAEGASTGIDPQASTALEGMGRYLRSLKAFTVHGAATIDVVDENDRKARVPGSVDYKVQVPDGLQMDVQGPHKHRQLFFDGKRMTLWAPDIKYYATVDAPPTIGELLARAEERYGITLPLADLFLWGTDKAPLSSIQSGKVGGHDTIGGTGCTRYVFQQPQVEWEVCIRDGDAPLPLRLTITDTEDPARPQFINTLTWDTAPKLAKTGFTFTPPKDAHRIQIVERGGGQPATAGGAP